MLSHVFCFLLPLLAELMNGFVPATHWLLLSTHRYILLWNKPKIDGIPGFVTSLWTVWYHTCNTICKTLFCNSWGSYGYLHHLKSAKDLDSHFLREDLLYCSYYPFAMPIVLNEVCSIDITINFFLSMEMNQKAIFLCPCFLHIHVHTYTVHVLLCIWFFKEKTNSFECVVTHMFCITASLSYRAKV